MKKNNIWIVYGTKYLLRCAINSAKNSVRFYTEKLLLLNANHYKNMLNAQPAEISVLKRRFGILFLLGCLVLTSIPTALCKTPTVPIVYVAGDGSGDFNCDGKKDQVQINQALKFVSENPEYTTVYLKGPFTYTISDSLLIGNNITLEGDSTAVLTVNTDSLWPKEKPMICQINPDESKGHIIVRGFEINGQADTLNSNFAASQGKTELRGDGYYNMIFVYYADVEIYNMYLHDSLGDGLRIKYSESVKFHDNRVYKLGHDVFYPIKCQNVEAWNNNIRTMTNSAVRLWNTNHAKIHDNVIYTEFGPDAGGPGIQIQYNKQSNYVMDDIEVYNNTIYDTYGPGIWLIGYDSEVYSKLSACNVHIHHNVFYGCGTHPTYNWVCGIETSGFNNTLIENNVFNGNYHAAVALQAALNLTPPGSGYTTIVRNNIISNTKERKYQPAGTGNGVVNYLTETHSFILQNNCFYNNTGGDYKNTEGSDSDIHVDPLFADQDNHDYHLKSVAGRWDGATWVYDNVSSPCIDAGYPFSDYSNEPEDNGDRINIGRYGNTIYASKSIR